MSDDAISLPILTGPRALRLTPTDVSQFVRLEQCERFLRFRLAERAGQEFMQAYDVHPQRITPLLSRSGDDFEKQTEQALAAKFRTVHFAEKSAAHNRPDNNGEVIALATKLEPGETLLFFQARLEAHLHGWRLRGDVDLMRLERDKGGTLRVLIADMKSTALVKVEHRLQVAFYRLMAERLFAEAGIEHSAVQTGILFRPPVDPSPDEEETIRPLRQSARERFGLDGPLVEIVADGDAYIQSANDLVLGEDSTARRVARTPFEDVAYCLSFKCDGCLYNEFCMKWSAEKEDLSLLPYMTGTEKEALRRAGVDSIQTLATLKELAPKTEELLPASGRESQVKQLAATWPVGPWLDELIHRAKSFRGHVRKDGTKALPYIPGKGNSTLPVSTPELNPNLIRIYMDAQHDYLEERVYLLGALVVACKNGNPKGRRAVVQLADGPPESAARERRLFNQWTRALLEAIIELAEGPVNEEGKKTAPIHVIFFDRHEQKLMLEALARNFPNILEATPPLYDFLTQLAAYDSPIATFLDEEIRTFKNFPMTCQNLQSVAKYLKFDWSTPRAFRKLFKARVFDYVGKLDIDGASEWFTRRSRFSSSLPLEYAYAAWGELPAAAEGKGDPFADFRSVTRDDLLAFETRRLEALEHICGHIKGNPYTEKSAFSLPDLAHFEDRAQDLAHALEEFVLIERLVVLNDWKATRHAPPERRVLMGEALLVRYCEEDQTPEVVVQNRENLRRQRKEEEYKRGAGTPHPDPPPQGGREDKGTTTPRAGREESAKSSQEEGGLTKEQRAECKWSPEGLQVRLRLECEGVDCDLHEAILMSSLREGDRLVLCPRWTVDSRLPENERKEFTPTPKQMLYGQRAQLLGIKVVKADRAGRVVKAFADVELQVSRGNKYTKPFVFNAFHLSLEDGKLYTLDNCPDEWYAYWCKTVVEGLCAGEPNTLYDRLANPPPIGDGAGSKGQARFLKGLDAFAQAGHLHDFEESKRQFIDRHAHTPILLVQGPPGTGKSYSTAFAIFARLQGAMREEKPCRVFLSCKTHAATDVLLQNVVQVQHKLAELKKADPERFGKYFEERLLEVPIYRVDARDTPPEGSTALEKKRSSVTRIEKQDWAIVGVTPGGTYGMLKDAKRLFDRDLCDLLVLDEASQMSLPEAIMAALPLKPDGQLIVVGDHRQMPPIVKHDWQAEARRTFRKYQVYESLFDTLRVQHPAMIRFAESFRLHQAMAEFLRQEVYRHDGIPFHSRRKDCLPKHQLGDPLAESVLHPAYPLVVVVHDEGESQVRNLFEQELIKPILKALADPKKYGLDAQEGLGIVVPHRAQRAALQQSFPELGGIDATGMARRSAIDTVERFQGGERTVILVSATESDRAYLLASSEFLLDPRRLTVALSRAKRKMILVASRSIFSLFSPDEETFANALLWKNLLLRTCTELLWSGIREGKQIWVWGGKGEA